MPKIPKLNRKPTRFPSGEGSIGHDKANLAFFDAQPGDIDMNNPNPDQRLRQFLVIFIIICSCMIGTGIFVTPTTVFHYTHSVGIKMLVWLCGSIAAIAGTLIYIEFGLTTPSFGRNEITVPRNHYLKDIFKRPAFFTNCLFGVILGIRVLEAAGYGHKISTQTLRETVAPGGPDNWKARVIAIVVVTFAVILHVTSRQAGIIVNNAFAIIKVLILLFIITGFVLQVASNNFAKIKVAAVTDM